MENVFAKFLQTKGMYDSIEISKDNYNQLFDLISGNVRISEYCVQCKEKRVFSMRPIISYLGTRSEEIKGDYLGNILGREDAQRAITGQAWTWNRFKDQRTRVMHFPFVCTMDPNHHLDYVLMNEGNLLVKIGQYPTVADLTFPQFDEVQKVIDKESLGELRRAIGLYAHGIGVGSYVYLRRIFERIINEAKKEADNNGISIEGFDGLRMSEKIKALKDYLPPMITSNAAIYGIVSKGIHELSEDECLRYFPVMKESIYLILKKWAERKSEEEAEQELNKAINAINMEVAGKE